MVCYQNLGVRALFGSKRVGWGWHISITRARARARTEGNHIKNILSSSWWVRPFVVSGINRIIELMSFINSLFFPPLRCLWTPAHELSKLFLSSEKKNDNKVCPSVDSCKLSANKFCWWWTWLLKWRPSRSVARQLDAAGHVVACGGLCHDDLEAVSRPPEQKSQGLTKPQASQKWLSCSFSFWWTPSVWVREVFNDETRSENWWSVYARYGRSLWIITLSSPPPSPCRCRCRPRPRPQSISIWQSAWNSLLLIIFGQLSRCLFAAARSLSLSLSFGGELTRKSAMKEAD